MDDANLRLFNCVLCDNTAVGGNGGGLHVLDADLKVKSTTFANNTGGNGGAVYIAGGGTHTIVNSILWDNAGDPNAEIALNGASITVTYTDVEGDYTGTGNLNVNPEFVDGGACDLHLVGSSDVIDMGIDTSAAADILDYDLDANTTEALPDRDLERRVLPCAIDMGAYEYPSCPWDIAPPGGDGTVGNADFNEILLRWGACEEECCPGDTVGYVSPSRSDETGDIPDGTVGQADLTDLLLHWGPCSGESFGGGGEIEDPEELAALVEQYAPDGFTEEEIDAIWELLESWAF